MSNYTAGQGILAKIRFRDGKMPLSDRTYLIVETGDNFIKVLNVSSSEGKESKLQMKSNEPLSQYEPPFKKPSFVKLDSLVRIDNPPSYKILHNGDLLNNADLSNIITKLKEYN